MMGLFLRMSRWARNPPSLRQALVIAAIVLVGLGLASIEWVWGWPDWLTVNRVPRRTGF